MRITAVQLRQLIKEELIKSFSSSDDTVVFEFKYKKRFHPSVIKADLALIANRVGGEFTHDGDRGGSIMCPRSYAHVVEKAWRRRCAP